jgi:hypothetical protein
VGRPRDFFFGIRPFLLVLVLVIEELSRRSRSRSTSRSTRKAGVLAAEDQQRA